MYQNIVKFQNFVARIVCFSLPHGWWYSAKSQSQAQLMGKLFILYCSFNSTSTHSYAELSLLKAYITICKFNLLCLSAKYFDSSIACNDINLAVPGYSQVRSEHRHNCKRGGVCNYYKTLCYLLEYIEFDVKIGGKLYNFLKHFTIVFSLILILLIQKLLT